MNVNAHARSIFESDLSRVRETEIEGIDAAARDHVILINICPISRDVVSRCV